MEKSTSQEIQLSIDRLSSKGRGIAEFSRSPNASTSKVEVFSTIPGDRVTVLLQKKQKGIYRSKLLKVEEPSKFRVNPRCPHVLECGGCVWQQMDYQAQLQLKQTLVTKAFGSLLTNDVIMHEIIACSTPWEYRNKMEFSFSQNRNQDRFLGLMQSGARGVFNLKECHLSPPWLAKTLCAVRDWWEKTDLKAYHLGKDEGSLRNLTLREGKHTKDKLVMLTVSGNPQFALKQKEIASFIQAIKDSIDSGNLSIFLRIQQIAKGTPTQFYELHLFGPDHINEKLSITYQGKKRTLIFKVSPTSFFQPNTSQAEILYSRALEMLKTPYFHVLDLYCGTATLGMALSLGAQKVTGIELNPHAVFDAKANIDLNAISNLNIHCGDVGRVLNELKAQSDFIIPDTVVVDPPRSGLDPLALKQLIDLSPKQILYVSCNPQTQAANIVVLQQAGYQLLELQPVDQFPHTVHIENIALLQRG